GRAGGRGVRSAPGWPARGGGRCVRPRCQAIARRSGAGRYGRRSRCSPTTCRSPDRPGVTVWWPGRGLVAEPVSNRRRPGMPSRLLAGTVAEDVVVEEVPCCFVG